MLDAAEHLLQLENFRRDQVLELRLRRPPLTEAVPIGAFLDQVAAPSPTPGGGTVAAFVGALAATLPAMVAGLTIGKKSYAASEDAMREVKRRVEQLRIRLLGLARQDSEAFEAVLRARRMADTTAEEKAMREQALRAAELEATRVPLRTAAACVEVVEQAAVAARLGNRNAVTDAGVAGLLARAAAEGALLNVQINLKSLGGTADKDDVETELQRIRAALGTAARDCEDAVHAGLNA
jgi:glutamate formiminotransferase/formiminotetrahydrofolate cyclodeaminase